MDERSDPRVQNGEEKSVQCYLCGRSVTKHYITERIEPRIATRFHGKRVKICIYCAEEWDEEFPGTIPEDTEAPPEEAFPGLSEEESAAQSVRADPAEQPLTKRQAERLAWYHNVTPVQGYDVKSAILRDDAFGAVAHEADKMGLSYGYYMVRKEAEAGSGK